MTVTEIGRFVEKYQLARKAALQSFFDRGTSGLEMEWNVTNGQFRPLHHVGSGPDARSFSEVLRKRFVPPTLADRNDLEVFHWMTEWITRPYYHPAAAVYEARILEACLLNALNMAGLSFGDKFYAWHGNVLWPIDVDYRSIPAGWELAKRRYLERCVDLFGSKLATAGVHHNVSLPEPLFSLDFLHQPADGREESSLVAYRNAAYIRGCRLLRAFAALTLATSAASPLRGEWRDGKAVIVLTELDSNRLARFPNPPTLDVPELYRTHADYVRISSDLVRRRVRFGNNNWTPARARSDRASVDHIIDVTSDQLHEVHERGIYGVGEQDAVEQLAQRIEVENMLARIELPMTRVEVRTDEGGHELPLDIANLMLKQLLLMVSYADPAFSESFAYSSADIERVRANEAIAAEHGLRAEIADPFTGRKVGLRPFLKWTLDQVRPLAKSLEWEGYLQPLEALAGGAPNSAEKLRARLRLFAPNDLVPVEAMRELVEERQQQVARDVQTAIAACDDLGEEAGKLRDLLDIARDAAHADPSAPVKFHVATRPRPTITRDTTEEVVELSRQLIAIPSVTNCPQERLDQVQRAARFIAGYLRDAGLTVRFYDDAKYPAVLAHFPEQLAAPVMLSGHFDVVAPAPDDRQFEPRIDGDYLWGRGSADIKTVVATNMVWMKDVMRRNHGRFPPINMLLVGNEENGEGEPTGTPHVLADLKAKHNYQPALLIAGERTGEKGTEKFGEVCVENRGVVRVEFVARGEQGHTGTGGAADLGARILELRQAADELLKRRLTLTAADGWKTEFRFPFVNVGTPGVYNITADLAQLGVEIRPIPQDDAVSVLAELETLAKQHGAAMQIVTKEPGVACRRDNPYLLALLSAVREVSGAEPQVG